MGLPDSPTDVPRINAAEEQLAQQIRDAGDLPVCCRQYPYAPGRKFRADFAFIEARLLVEVQGGIWQRKAHGSIKGILADIERLNQATLWGWRLLRITAEQLNRDEVIPMIRHALKYAPILEEAK